jgi:hypothetical protein
MLMSCHEEEGDGKVMDAIKINIFGNSQQEEYSNCSARITPKISQVITSISYSRNT